MITFGDTDKTEEYGTPYANATDVEGVVVVGYDPNINKWLSLKWADKGTAWLVGDGKEKGESFAQTAVRELKEETGYSKFTEQIQLGGPIVSHYYNDKKDLHRRSNSMAYLFVLDSSSVGKQALEAHEDFTVEWLDYDPLVAAIKQTGGGVEHWLAVLARAKQYASESF